MPGPGRRRGLQEDPTGLCVRGEYADIPAPSTTEDPGAVEHAASSPRRQGESPTTATLRLTSLSFAVDSVGMTKLSMDARETFDLPAPLQEALEKRAAKEVKTKAAIMREALMAWLNWKPREGK